MVQWLRILFPMQGMQVRSLVGKLGSRVPQDTVTRETHALQRRPSAGPPRHIYIYNIYNYIVTIYNIVYYIYVVTIYNSYYNIYDNNGIPGSILSIYMFYLIHSSNIPVS